MNAISYLISEHNKFRRNFAKIKTKKSGQAKENLFDQLCLDLLVHETMEQKVWYPKISKDKEIQKQIKHLKKEEKKAEDLIKSFDKVKTSTQWESKFNKLKKEVEHHAKEEEKNLFPIVEENLDAKQLQSLGKQMSSYKTQLTNKVKQDAPKKKTSKKKISKKKISKKKINVKKKSSKKSKKKSPKSKSLWTTLKNLF